MKRNLLILVIILLIGLIVNSCGGGDDEEKPTPTQQTYPIDLGNGKKVNVNYKALPGTTPAYMSNLVGVLQELVASMPAGTYTIDVVDGNNGFAKTGSKTLSVGKSWISGATYEQIGVAIGTLILDWIAMIQPTHDKGWKQLKGYSARITNANVNLLYLSYVREKLIPCRCTSLYNDNFSGGKIKEYWLLII